MKKVYLAWLIATVLTLSQATAQRINIGYIYPAGVAQGSTAIISIGGQSISTATQVMISGEGVTAEILPPSEQPKSARRRGAKISDEDNLQLAQSLKVKVTVADDAELGVRDLKVVGKTGIISNMLFFEVGAYSDFTENEPNNTIAEANKIETLPVTINGYVEKSTVVGDMERSGGGLTQERAGKDFFSFEAKRGESIVAEVKARTFVPYLADAVPGWFQSVVSIYDESGREVAYCDDYMYRVDPVIIYNVPKSGRYYLKIHDSIYRGREDFVYRINLGVIPFISSIYPLGGEANRKSKVEIRGVNIGGKSSGDTESLTTTLNTSKLQAGAQTIRYTPNKGKSPSNEFLYNISQTKITRTLTEDSGVGESITTAINITTDETINARIDSAGDVDWYSFEAPRPRGNMIIQVMGRRLGSPIDAKLTIHNSRGEKIDEVDDTVDPSQGFMTHHADPEMSLRIKEAGRYFIRVSETQNRGGEEYGYQLRIKDFQPDYMLSIEPSSLSIPQGGTSIITLFAERKYNFRGKINLSFEGLPEGFEVSATQYAGMAKSMKIAITAPMTADVGAIDLKVIGTSQIGDSEVVSREARPAQVMKQAFYIDHLISSKEFRVDVTPADPFTLTLEPMEGNSIRLKREGTTQIRVVAHRQEGFNDEIQIMKKIVPQGIFFSSITIPAGQNEGVLEVETPFWNPKQKTARMMLMGTVKASTNNRVAGQARNTINATIMVNSPYTEVVLPTTADPVSREELRRLLKLNK